MEHPPCECPEPTSFCPRYGFMMGVRHATCRGAVNAARRGLYLDSYAGVRGREARGGEAIPDAPPPAPREPVGSRLKALLAQLGLPADGCWGCGSLASQMDRWGAEGCRENRDQILGWLRQQQAKLGWAATVKAAVLAAATGLAFKLDPSDPAPGLLDEAIRRAEARGTTNADGFTGVLG